MFEQGIDTSMVEGWAMFGVLLVLAALQRELIMANTNDGLASARACGRIGGGGPKLTEDQVPLAQRLYGERERTVQQIADMFGVPRSMVYGTSTEPRLFPASRRRPRSRSPDRCFAAGV
ncbi:hypothetical protein ACWCXX_30545 [Streptomyces sp. NPDC001732]